MPRPRSEVRLYNRSVRAGKDLSPLVSLISVTPRLQQGQELSGHTCSFQFSQSAHQVVSVQPITRSGNFILATSQRFGQGERERVCVCVCGCVCVCVGVCVVGGCALVGVRGCVGVGQ